MRIDPDVNHEDLNHIRLIGTSWTVCQRPEYLGNYFVANEFNPTKPSCTVCAALLRNKNEKDAILDNMKPVANQNRKGSLLRDFDMEGYKQEHKIINVYPAEKFSTRHSVTLFYIALMATLILGYVVFG